MSTRQRKPEPRLIPIYLIDAQITQKDTQAKDQAAVARRRVNAVRALHALWLRWREDVARVCAEQGQPSRSRRRRPRCDAETLPYDEITIAWQTEAIDLLRKHWITKLGAPAGFDLSLQNFFDRAGKIIFATADPLVAMHAFWEVPVRRGPQAASNAQRDFELAMDVQKRTDCGVTKKSAIAAVAAEQGMNWDRIRQIYYRQRSRVGAALELQELLRSPETK
jgi:hypothetical protein